MSTHWERQDPPRATIPLGKAEAGYPPPPSQSPHPTLLFLCPTGELSLDEFVEGARKDDEFMEVMMKSLDLSHIVAMINNRRHSV